MHQPEDKDQEKDQHQSTAHKTLLLAYGTEDEVGVLLGHILQFGLCAIKEPLAFKSARTYGYLGLDDIVSCSLGIILQSQKHTDTCLLVRLQDIVEDIVHRIEETCASYSKKSYEGIRPQLLANSKVQKVGNGCCQHYPQNPRGIERNEVLGIQDCQDVCSHTKEQNLKERLAQGCIYPHHAGREYVYGSQNKKLARTDLRYLPQGHLGIAHTHHKVEYSSSTGKKDAACHSFAVEHQEERQVYQS